MKKISIGALAVSSTLLSPIAAYAETEVHFWHAFTGRLGELVAAQVEGFNASQDNYTVVQSHKGNYSETLNAGIAAFRAGEQPQILMVFEVGTATMMAANPYPAGTNGVSCLRGPATSSAPAKPAHPPDINRAVHKARREEKPA